LENLGSLYHETNRHSEAEEVYAEAIDLYRQLANENPDTYLPGLARILSSLADFYVHTGQYALSLDKFEEALSVNRELAKENQYEYLPEVARVLTNIAVVLTNYMSHKEKADTFAREALQIATENQDIPALAVYAEKAERLLQANRVD
jgi:tetratricopeptide (TPR) repeat protein